ncbi:PIN domain-containing protein [Candidatus Gottesmanbacteria bacterium]|nr:PIN domain-containing protein [Candidatus Gottesmanbacteria bacterium]
MIDFFRTGTGALPNLLDAQRDKKLELLLSTVTILELFAGKSSKTTIEFLKELIDGFTVLPLGRELAVLAGEIKRDVRISGSLGDLIVGASAVSVGAKLATRNTRHYQGIPKLRFYSLSQKESIDKC